MNIGTIRMAGRSVANYTRGTEVWLLCDGQQVPQVTYPALFALIAVTYGPAVAGFFTLPNYGDGIGVDGRIPVGTSPTGYALGAVAGVNGHDHAFAIGTPDLVHAPIGITTAGPSSTTPINGAAVDPPPDWNVFHTHSKASLPNHPMSGVNIGPTPDLSPCLTVGFYIRGL